MSYLNAFIFSVCVAAFLGATPGAQGAIGGRGVTAAGAIEKGIEVGRKFQKRADQFLQNSGLPHGSYRAYGAAETGAMAASTSFRTAFAFLFPELSLAGDILRGAVANPIRALILSRGQSTGEGFHWDAASRHKLGLIAMRGVMFAGLFQLGKFAVKDVQVASPALAEENFSGAIFSEELVVLKRHSVGDLGKGLAEVSEEQIRGLANMSEAQLRELAARVEQELADRAALDDEDEDPDHLLEV